MANILIIGGGFGGLIAAEELSRLVGKEHRLTLVSPTSKFTFYPALVHLAFGQCEPDDITFNLVERLNELNVRFVEGEVIEVKAELKKVQVAGRDLKGEIFYDYLVIAAGRRLATEKIAYFFDHAHHLLDIKSALDFGEEVKAFHEGKIVVGMAPDSFLPVPVCETAFALARRFKTEIEKNQVSVKIVFPETIKEAFGGADLHHQLIQAFDRHQIDVIEGFPVKEVTAEEIKGNGQNLAYDLLMLLPPFRGQAFWHPLDVSDKLDFIVTDELMRVPNSPGVYAVGDIVNFSGPKLAQMTVRQATVAALNLAAEIRGEEPKNYYYHELVAIIDQGGSDSIYLHYGIWDKSLYRLKKGRFWSWAKKIHHRLWQAAHQG